MSGFHYTKVSSDELEKLACDFYRKHGDSEDGTIPDSEYDRLFDHLAGVLSQFGSFTEDSGVDADFNGYRYVDQIPQICIVPGKDLFPPEAIVPGVIAVNTVHRPLAVKFDYHPDYLLILPEGQVYGTYDGSKLGIAD